MQIFLLVDLMLVDILKQEARCNFPSENETPAIKFVIWAYHDSTSTLTGFDIKQALQAITLEYAVGSSLPYDLVNKKKPSEITRFRQVQPFISSE
jgi:hypothetical protein